jgi:hypothetical protein
MVDDMSGKEGQEQGMGQGGQGGDVRGTTTQGPPVGSALQAARRGDKSRAATAPDSLQNE